jgi:ABC-type lipoprotein release transport system permease subunit
VGWEGATGFVGQFIHVLRFALYVAVLIILLVAIVIVNNSMVMATLERVSEIGTMRAIGAQKGFILRMFVLEAVVLALLSGSLGALLGAQITLFLQDVGIPAATQSTQTTEVLIFLFGGPRLYPTVAPSHLLFGLGVILVVGLVSALYPAFLATRIQPIQAMQTED